LYQDALVALGSEEVEEYLRATYQSPKEAIIIEVP
jgi:hypothetical protein